MMKQYLDLVLHIETFIFNHGLLDVHHFDEVKHYKFMTPELKSLMNDIQDGYKHGYEPIPQALWDKCPTLYGKLLPTPYSNLPRIFKAAKQAKARVHVFNKISEHLGWVSMHTKPLDVTVDKIIADMQIVKERLNELS